MEDEKERGIENMRSSKYSDEFLIKYLQDYFKKNGRPPTMRTLPKGPGLPSAHTYIHRFGSWRAALEKAGLDTANTIQYTDQELIEYIRALGKKLGRPPTLQDVRKAGKPSAVTYLYRFGSWYNALKAAGYKVHRHGRSRELSRQLLVAKIKQLEEKLGYPPGPADIDNARAAGEDIPSSRTFYRYFGTWERLLVAAGLIPTSQ